MEKNKYLNESEISMLNDLIDLGFTDKAKMITALRESVIPEEYTDLMKKSLSNCSERLICALKAMDDADVQRLVNAHPLSSMDINNFPY